ncbi:haloacid dehalogenase-like hydrolase [Endozoicomonas sp.]|uniref:haloacid dehalogenase-like hydrolase n=1 Tax=Endozoicomonas sp. TaxID=1892382 RepID=UPI003AF6235E
MKVAYVDYCNTLYNGFSLSDFQKYSESELGLPFKCISIIFRAVGKLLRSEELKIFAFKFVDQRKVNKLIVSFSKKLNNNLILSSRDILLGYKKNGFKIVVVSASISDLIGGSDFDGFFDVILARRLCDFYKPLFYGKDKAEKIREWESQQKDIITERVAFSDHISDLSMLQLADKAYIINPVDPKLRSIAIENNWVLIDD